MSSSLDLFKKPEKFVQQHANYSTREEAIAVAARLGAAGGGVVQIEDGTNKHPEPVPTGKSVFLVTLANGTVLNVAAVRIALASGMQLNYAPTGSPAGVSFECDEVEYHAIRQQLSDSASVERTLAVEGGGVVAQGMLDTEVMTTDGFGTPPFAAGGPLPQCNYVIQLLGGVVVNAAFIGHMLKNFGAKGAAAFADTRR